MVFASLQPREKDAFFTLLDEYFASRPEIFAKNAEAERDSSPQAAATSAVHRAMVANPDATAKLVGAGLRHAANSQRTTPPSAASGASEGEATTVAGRVAAASLAFSARKNNTPPSGSPPIQDKPPTSGSSFTSTRKFGDVDTSSAKNFFGSIRNSTANKNATPPAPVIPAGLSSPPSANSYGPPPVRRGIASSPAPPPFRHQQQEEEEEEPEAQGEWAEALYDFESGEAGDLNITEGQRILVTERTSDDWWTGEVNGKSGLFPASYAKLL